MKMRKYVNSNKFIEGIYVCSAVMGGMIVISMPLFGAVLLVIAFLAGRLVKQANMEDEHVGAPVVNKVTACKIHANTKKETMVKNKEALSCNSKHVNTAA